MAKRSDTPGVRARSGSIQIDFRYKGERCRETIPLKPTKKNLQAIESLRGKIIFEILSRTFNYADYFPDSPNVEKFGGHPATNFTVKEALEWWFSKQEYKDPKTLREHKRAIEKYLIPGIGHIRLREIVPNQIVEWINSLDLSASSKNNTLSPLRGLFRFAHHNGYIKEDTMTKVPSFTRDKREKNPLKIDEIDKVLSLLHMREVQAFYQFAFWTGLSTGEQTGLQWGDINFETRKVKIERILVDNEEKGTKNEFRDRVIELLSPAIRALRNIAPKDLDENPGKYRDTYVFINPNTGAAWRYDALTLHWKRALKAGEIKYRRPYETRHTFASAMVSACVPDGWVRNQMGHADMVMLAKVYAKYLEDGDRVIEWIVKHTSAGVNGAQFEKLFLNQYIR